jgi:hypothetical protein
MLESGQLVVERAASVLLLQLLHKDKLDKKHWKQVQWF